MWPSDWRAQQTAIAILAVSALTLGGAYLFQYVGGLAPCEMCLWQRPAYWLAIAVTAVMTLAAPSRGAAPLWVLLALGLVGLAYGINAGSGVYHAGVEWKFWEGPTACGSVGGPSGGDLFEALGSARIVPCDEAAWRLFGISLAGYNALISGALAALSLWTIARERGA